MRVGILSQTTTSCGQRCWASCCVGNICCADAGATATSARNSATRIGLIVEYLYLATPPLLLVAQSVDAFFSGPDNLPAPVWLTDLRVMGENTDFRARRKVHAGILANGAGSWCGLVNRRSGMWVRGRDSGRRNHAKSKDESEFHCIPPK